MEPVLERCFRHREFCQGIKDMCPVRSIRSIDLHKTGPSHTHHHEVDRLSLCGRLSVTRPTVFCLANGLFGRDVVVFLASPVAEAYRAKRIEIKLGIALARIQPSNGTQASSDRANWAVASNVSSPLNGQPIRAERPC
jgi:hypothetical protein